MTGEVSFTKLSGSGNDFLCIDNRDGRYDAIIDKSERIGPLARALCARRVSVGADGVIFACATEMEDFADIAARFFEADGSEVELCGNGTGCFASWVIGHGWIDAVEIRILTSAGVVRACEVDPPYTRVCIPLPENLQTDLSVGVDGQVFPCDLVTTGVPHLVTRVEDIDRVDIERLGPALRHHEMFAPRGVNANFVEVLGEGHIAVRTFEFGVEDETLACGTGSASAAILTALRENWPDSYLNNDKPVLVRSRSGQTLRIWFTVDEDRIVTDLCLDTVVREIYQARLSPRIVQEALDDRPGPCRCHCD